MTGEETCVIPDQIRRLTILERKERKAGRQGFRAEFDAFLDTIEKKTLKKDQPLRKGEYRVHVTYTMPNDKETLEREFSKDGVSNMFTGNYYKWQMHRSCAKIDRTLGERIMFVKYFKRFTKSEPNIAKMEKLGYRPATHLETYAFAKANPELQRQFSIVALGSSMMPYGDRLVAVLDSDSDSGERILRVKEFYDEGNSGEWDPDCRFLFVRK